MLHRRTKPEKTPAQIAREKAIADTQHKLAAVLGYDSISIDDIVNTDWLDFEDEFVFELS